MGPGLCGCSPLPVCLFCPEGNPSVSSARVQPGLTSGRVFSVSFCVVIFVCSFVLGEKGVSIVNQLFVVVACRLTSSSFSGDRWRP